MQLGLQCISNRIEQTEQLNKLAEENMKKSEIGGSNF